MLLRFITFLFAATLPCAWCAGASAGPMVMLKKLLIADTETKATALPADSGGNVPVFVQDVAVLADAGFSKAAEKFIGKQLTPETLDGLQALIIKYAKDHDRLIVKVSAPPQDASGGIVRLVVAIGRYGEISLKGNRWFSSKMLREKMGLKSGDEVRISTLEEAVNWANANPFRQIKVLVNDLDNQPGKADLIIGVEERIPLRFTASYDNSGNDYIGNNHYTGSIQFGNLWGRDHQGSYQYTTTDHRKLFESHAVDYRVPLPWRHYLQLNVGYLTVHPTFGANNEFTQNGENLSASARYIFPLRAGASPIEMTTGLDFKQGNNSLAYGLRDITATTNTFQLVNSISMVKRDRRGAWLFATSVNASPGNINERNTNTAFSTRKIGDQILVGKSITATYITGIFSVQRLLNLDGGWSIFSRGMYQYTSGSLPGGEQLSIGGSSTVRGFNERILSGDQGYVLSTDLQAPAIRTSLPFLGKNRPPLETRFIAFYDAAQVEYKFADANDVPLVPMHSAGLGVRMSLASNFNLSADYGRALTSLPASSPRHSRGHIKVVLAF